MVTLTIKDRATRLQRAVVLGQHIYSYHWLAKRQLCALFFLNNLYNSQRLGLSIPLDSSGDEGGGD